MQVRFATWVGNGTTQDIAIVGLPGSGARLVQISGGANVPVIATNTMASGGAKPITGGTALTADGVSWGADKFTVGTNAGVNASGTTYRAMVVWDDGDSTFATGSYTGLSTGGGVADNREIASLVSPNLVVVMGAGAQSARLRMSTHLGDLSQNFDNSAAADGIQNFSATGFQIGTSSTVNSNAVVYHWAAFKNLASVFKVLDDASNRAYTCPGSLSDNRAITGVGFQPQAAWTKSAGSSTGALRFKDHSGDLSKSFSSAAATTNQIQAFSSDGFEAGTSSAVQVISTNYHACFWRETGAAPPVITPDGTPVTAIGARRATVGWTTDKVATSQVGLSTVSLGPYTYQPVTDSTADLTTHSVVVTGLLPSTLYYYVKRSIDVDSNATTSTEASFSTIAADATPPVVSADVGTPTGSTTAVLAFTTDDFSSSNAEYRVQGSVTWLPIPLVADATADNIAHSIALTGLVGATTYEWRAMPTNEEGLAATGTTRTFATPSSLPASLVAFNTHATPASIGLEIIFADDTNQDVSVGEYLVVLSAGVLSGVTTIPVAALPHPVYAGSDLTMCEVVVATGQIIEARTVQVTADAAAGATSLTVTALGSNLATTGGRGAFARISGLRFKKAADSAWRYGIPLEAMYPGGFTVDDGNGNGLYGSVLLCDAVTAYDIEVTVTDPDGITSAATLPHRHNDVAGTAATVTTVGARKKLTTVVTTAAEPAAVGTSTHFVNPATGSDLNLGTSSGAAWATLAKAIAAGNAATADMVIEFAPGAYIAQTTLIRPPTGRKVTFKAQYDAVAYSATTGLTSVANAGNHSIVAYGSGSLAAITGPLGSGAPYETPWVQDLVLDPSGTIWKWAACPGTANSGAGSTFFTVGAHPTLAATPQRQAHWRRGPNDFTATAADWATQVLTNHTYNYGAYKEGTTLYLRLTPDTRTAAGVLTSNPNAVWVTYGEAELFKVGGTDVRIRGFAGRGTQYGIHLVETAVRAVVEYNYVSGAFAQVRVFGNRTPTPDAYGTDHVCQYNLLEDTHHWGLGGAHVIPWNFTKISVLGSDNLPHSSSDIGGQNESCGFVFHGGGKRITCRYNTIDGPFNSFTAFSAGFDRYATAETDLHDNWCLHAGDDSHEPENSSINWRIWNQRVAYCLTALSLGPCPYGVIYAWGNSYWRIGADGVGDDPNTQFTPSSYSRTRKPIGLGFKYSGYEEVPARCYFLYNTHHTDSVDPFTAKGTDFANNSAGGFSKTGATPPYHPDRFTLYGNIITATRYIANVLGAGGTLGQWPDGPWVEDFNIMVTNDAPARTPYPDPQASGHGLKFLDVPYTDVSAGALMADYRAASGQGARSNVVGSATAIGLKQYATVAAEFIDPANGDLRLKGSSIFLGQGVPYFNIMDRPGTEFVTLPDLGYRQGAASLSAATFSTPTAGSISTTAAVISWTTSPGATSRVDYATAAEWAGTPGVYPSSTSEDTTIRTAHARPLTGLTASTTYHFRAYGVTAAGTSGTSVDGTFATTAVADVTAPTISLVVVDQVAIDGGRVGWRTDDEPGNSKVEWDTNAYFVANAAYRNTVSDLTLYGAQHALTIAGAPDETLLAYKITSADAVGNAATTTGTFTTLEIVVPPDPILPVASGGSVESGAVLLAWTTNIPATTQVSYRLAGGAEQLSSLVGVLTTAHEVVLADLPVGAYTWGSRGADVDGNNATPVVGTFGVGAVTGRGRGGLLRY